MKAPTNGFLTNAGEEERKSINSELWHACAGPLVSLPPVGSLVVYFPQGHSEQVSASMQKKTDFIPNYPNLLSKLICMLHNLTLHADPETDEVYAQMTLQPVTKYEKDTLLVTDLGLKQGRQPAEFFCKTLTASDTSTHGGFSVPRRAAEKILPPLDFSMQPPSQELVARDLHDNSWTFRHIYRGQPKRHLLTTGWSVFVSTKRLFAGDSVLFIRDEKSQLLLGTRSANRQQPALSSSVISSDSMHIGILAAAAHAAANNSPFTIFYNPRTSPSEFVISLAKYNKAMYTQISLGMRFRMLFETEDSGVRRYMGTVTGISDLDPVRWKNSQWRNLQVGWDESAAGERPSRVSIWEIDPVITPFYICPPSFFRPKFPKQPGMPDDESDMENAFKQAMPWLGDDFGLKDTLPGLSLVQWMSMQQQNNQQFPSNQSGFFPSIVSTLNNFSSDDPSKLLSFRGPPNLHYNNKPNQVNQVNQLQPPQLLQNPINQQTQKLTERQLTQPAQLNNAVVSSVNQPVMCSQLQQQQQPQDSSHFQQQIEQQPISFPTQQQMQAQLLQQSLSQRMQRAPHQMLSEQQIQLQLLQKLQHQQQLLSQQQHQQQPQQLLSRAGPNFPPLLPHQQPVQDLQQNQQLSQLGQQQHMNSDSFPAEKRVNNTNICPTAGPIQTYQIHPVAQQQPLPQAQLQARFKPLNAIRGHSVLTDGDAPSCSTSPSANNCLVSAPNFTNRNQQGSMSLAGDSLIEPSSNMLQELLRKSENGVKHDLVSQKGQDQLKYKGPITDPLEASSSGTSYCLDASTIHQTFHLPTFCLDTSDVQSHPQNNLPFAAANLNGFNNPDNTLLSRGYDSQKDLHNLLSNYGGTARDIETELSAADISRQSLVPQNMSFMPSCSNDVTINETAVLNGGMWTSQSQKMRTYTKVQKRGSVGRCIDVTSYKGYDELRNDLARMFGIEGQLEDPLRTEWKLVYVDHENDILLVGDDPWEEFVSCVQSIKILSLAEVQRMSLDGDLGYIQQVSNQACSGTESGNAWRGQFDDNSAASFDR